MVALMRLADDKVKSVLLRSGVLKFVMCWAPAVFPKDDPGLFQEGMIGAQNFNALSGTYFT